MGRGNICTHNECEGLYYLDKDLLDVYRKVNVCDCGCVEGFDYDEEPMTARELQEAGVEYDFDGARTGLGFDESDSRSNWMYMVDYMIEKMIERFPSFDKVDTWRGSNQNIVMRNGLFEIAVADNEWSAAWLLLEREDVDDDEHNRTLMRRHHATYLEAIKRALIEDWGEAVGYGGAWTHGKKYTQEDLA